jgi:hypothetical protein
MSFAISLLAVTIASVASGSVARPAAATAAPRMVAHADRAQLPTAVDLSVMRRQPGPTVGVDTVVVSSGVPLPPGLLRPGATRRVRLQLDYGSGFTEQPVYVEQLTSVHPDGSLRSILVQFRASMSGRAPRARLVFDAPRAAAMDLRAPAGVKRGLPDYVALSTTPNYLLTTDLVGPTLSASVSRSLGPMFVRYENDFVKFMDSQWAQYGVNWESSNYYDRVLINYAWWVRTGDPKWFDRATQIAVDYRARYLEKNNFSASPHWAQLEGLELHYLLTGDSASKRAVIRTATNLFGGFDYRIGDANDAYTENRIQARVIQSYYLAWRLGDTSAPWEARLDAALNGILSTQSKDGGYRFKNTCYHTLNYMAGLLNDQLIKHYTYYRADPRIPIAVQKSADYLLTQWMPAQQALQYYDGECPGSGGRTPAADVNNLISGTFAWVYLRTGEQRYRQAADAFFAGGVRGAYLTGVKQLNESYTNSFRYLAWRLGARPTTASVP